MIQSSASESHYRHMLREAGFSEQRPDALLAWRVFKDFAEVPVECSEDALLFQCGVYDFTGRDLFHFGFVRQFTFEEDGEYDHMEQLDCSLLFEPDGELQQLETNLWSYDFSSAGTPRTNSCGDGAVPQRGIGPVLSDGTRHRTGSTRRLTIGCRGCGALHAFSGRQACAPAPHP